MAVAGPPSGRAQPAPRTWTAQPTSVPMGGSCSRSHTLGREEMLNDSSTLAVNGPEPPSSTHHSGRRISAMPRSKTTPMTV